MKWTILSSGRSYTPEHSLIYSKLQNNCGIFKTISGNALEKCKIVLRDNEKQETIE